MTNSEGKEKGRDWKGGELRRGMKGSWSDRSACGMRDLMVDQTESPGQFAWVDQSSPVGLLGFWVIVIVNKGSVERLQRWTEARPWLHSPFISSPLPRLPFSLPRSLPSIHTHLHQNTTTN